MKYSTNIAINKPIKETIELFDNPENMKHWQDGFISMELIEGENGKEGAKSLLKYEMGKRKIEMIETIIKRDLPHEFTATYEAKGVYNIVKNNFIKLNENKTTWISHNEFQFKGMMKLMAIFMPGAFKKQSFNMMENFKRFTENNINNIK